MLPVEQPFKTYTGLDGKPLDNGYVWFGLPNQNPQTAPVTVFWDAAGTIPAAQPLRTVNGYIYRGGTPANVFFDGAYSELVWDSKRRQVFYARTSDEFSIASAVSKFLAGLASSVGTSLIGWARDATGSIATTLAKWLGWQEVSVFEFMVDALVSDIQAGSLLLDATASIQKAVDAVANRGRHGVVKLPAGKYRVTAPILVPYGVSIIGEGGTASELVCYSCDGIHFTTYGYQIGSMLYTGFGLTSGAGANFTAIVALPGADTMDGLYFDHLRFYSWNECFNLEANRDCWIENCNAQTVNVFVATAGSIVGLRLSNNRAICAGGGNGNAAKVAVDIRGGTIQESIHLHNNYLYGFDYCFRANTVSLFVNIQDNDLNALVAVISYTTVNAILNIQHNYIETFGVGLIGNPQSSQTPTTQTTICYNDFAGINGTATVGLQLNNSANTYQFNTVINDNVFSGFQVHDMQLYVPGRTFAARNRLMSTVPAQSLWVGQVIVGPVKLEDNWLNGALYSDNPPDIASGLLILNHNTEANTFKPHSGVFTPTFVPQTGAFGAITYGQQSGFFERVGNVCNFSLSIYTLAVTPGTAGGLLYIGGLPFSARAGVVAAFNVSDVRGWTASKGPCAGSLSSVAGAPAAALFNRSASNGDTTLVNAVDLANSNPGNILTISGSYLCA